MQSCDERGGDPEVFMLLKGVPCAVSRHCRVDHGETMGILPPVENEGGRSLREQVSTLGALGVPPRAFDMQDMHGNMHSLMGWCVGCGG